MGHHGNIAACSYAQDPARRFIILSVRGDAGAEKHPKLTHMPFQECDALLLIALRVRKQLTSSTKLCLCKIKFLLQCQGVEFV